MTADMYRNLAARLGTALAATTGLGVMLFFAWLLLQVFMGGE